MKQRQRRHARPTRERIRWRYFPTSQGMHVLINAFRELNDLVAKLSVPPGFPTTPGAYSRPGGFRADFGSDDLPSLRIEDLIKLGYLHVR